MEARLLRVALFAAAFASLGASQRTHNFVVTAATPEIATQVGQLAEEYRRDLAIEWLGKPMPNWSRPCPITVQVAPHLGAGGETSFVFDRGEVYGWQMRIQGSLERVLDSVLPHEVTHTIFASHFRQPLPRWADEGACTTVEHAVERRKHQRMLIEFLKTGRGISFSEMFAMTQYPHDVFPLYAQGHSVSSFLLEQGGKRTYVKFVGDGLESEAWSEALRTHYGYASLAAFQDMWLNWVRIGSPTPVPAEYAPNIASGAIASAAGADRDLVVRAQSDDRSTDLFGRSQASAPSIYGSVNESPAAVASTSDAPSFAAAPTGRAAGNPPVALGQLAAVDDSAWRAAAVERGGSAGAVSGSISGLAAASSDVPPQPRATADGVPGQVSLASWTPGDGLPVSRARQTLVEWTRPRDAAPATAGTNYSQTANVEPAGPRLAAQTAAVGTARRSIYDASQLSGRGLLR